MSSGRFISLKKACLKHSFSSCCGNAAIAVVRFFSNKEASLYIYTQRT